MDGTFLLGKQEVELVEHINVVFAMVAAAVDDAHKDFLALTMYDSSHGHSLVR